MTGIQTYASQAELAWAAYASLSIGNNNTSAYETAGEALVSAKAKTLSTRYTVQAIHNDPLTGAYAVLFLDTQTQQQTLAIRGTEGAGDVLADLHLLVGIPAWMSLQYQSLVSKIEQWQVQGLIGAQTSITGHSLGGYLAAAVKSYYPSSFGATYTFNAPGLGGALGSVAQFFQNAFGITPSLSQVYGLRGSAGLSFIAGTGAQIGQTIPVEIEPAAGLGLANHSIARISQSLAVFGLLAKLDAQLSLAQANQLLAAASPQSGNSLENLVFAIDRTILGATAPASTGDDQALYTRLNALQDSPTFQTLAGKLKIEPTHSAEASKTDFAAFLSLQAGAAFSLRLRDPADSASEAQLYAANRAASEPWLADKTLRSQGGDLSKLNFTDTYLNDRSAYANRLIERNIKDIGGILAGNQNLRFYDASTTTQILVGAGSSLRSQISFGDSNANTVEGGAIADRLYGGAGADTLDGKAGADYLEGGADNDILRGGDNDQASDVLIGGKGIDSYQFSGLFGNDSITDSDGLGNITINGVQIAGLTQVQDNVWENDSKTLVLTQVSAAAASSATGGQAVTNLIIGQRTSAGAGTVNATITVNNWKDGNLGITLGTQTKKIDTNAFVIAGRTGDQGQNIPEAGFFGASQWWVYTGTVANRSLDAGAGNDLISGSAQADTITGGAGNDFLAGGGGADTLLGGAGFDYIVADVRANPNGGLDENGQLRPPPSGFSDSNILTAAYTGTDSPMQGYGWAIYSIDSNNTISVPITRVHSGDKQDVFIDGGEGTDNLWGAAGNDNLHNGQSAYCSTIDSKLLIIYVGEGSISFKKQYEISCKQKTNKRRATLKAKQTVGRHISSIVCYGNGSNLSRSIAPVHVNTSALVRAGVRHV